jgi:uncharacterized protein YodC (DUF2158 family)
MNKVREFCIGDVVRLKSGGPLMCIEQKTIYTVDSSPACFFTCAWIDVNGLPHKKEFSEQCLSKA